MDLYQICCCLLFQLLVFSQHCQGNFNNKSRQEVFLDQIEQAVAELFGLEDDYNKIPRQDLLELSRFIPLPSDRITSIAVEGRKLDVGSDIINFIQCGACKIISKIILAAVKLAKLIPPIIIKPTVPVITFFLRTICNLYIHLRTTTLTTFCREIIQLHEPILTHIMLNSKILSSELICSVLLQLPKCHSKVSELSWTVSVPEKPINLQSFPPKDNKNLTKILHLSDFHISKDYEIGSVVDCRLPVCCKRGLGNPVVHKQRAGKWGNAKYCDTSDELFLSTLEHIKKEHKDIQLIYFTGDIIDHQIWTATRKHNIELITYVYDQLRSYFPDVPLIPVIGNHEAVPLDAYPPRYIKDERFSQQWLYDTMADSWGKFLPNSTRETIEKQGYYTLLISPQLRIIALNNNICYRWNWWLLYDTRFLKEQLEWLIEVLFEAEKNGELVHIVSHVPTGNKQCIMPWEKNYNRIISRFEHIISGQFVGHTHTDEIKVFYNTETEQPNSVVFNGASLTPYTNFNPNYKIYTLNPDTSEVIDQETFTFNLTLANENPEEPIPWYRLYSLREAFGLKDLSPNSIHEMAINLSNNETLLHDYFRFYVRDADPSLKKGCVNAKCRINLICKIVHSEFQVTNTEFKEYCSSYFKYLSM